MAQKDMEKAAIEPEPKTRMTVEFGALAFNGKKLEKYFPIDEI